MKKEPLHSPAWPRYATIAVILTGAIATALGVRDSLVFGGIRPILIVGIVLIVAGLVVLGITYQRSKSKNLPSRARSR